MLTRPSVTAQWALGTDQTTFTTSSTERSVNDR
jgi:hypothetical protein